MFLLAKKAYSLISKVVFVISIVFIILGLAFQFGFKDDTQVSTAQVLKYQETKIQTRLEELKKDTSTEGTAKLALYKLSYCTFTGHACTDVPEENYAKSMDDSYIGFIAKTITFPMINPPASGVVYVTEGLQNAGFIPQTYAAEGIGFAAIKPLTTIWKVMRDIAYIVLVIVMVIIGFMIMFRMQIDAQTVISIENSLPRIVITLILVTFSFPIAGFFIDLMYIFIALVVSLLATNTDQIGILQNQYLSATPGEIFDSLIPLNATRMGYWGMLSRQLGGVIPVGFFDTVGTLWQTANGILMILPKIVSTTIFVVAMGGMGLLLEKLVNFADKTTEPLTGLGALTFNIGNMAKAANPIVLIIGAIIIGFIAVPLTIMFLIFTTVCLIFFRIFFMLLSTYLKILMLIIFSPVILLLGAIPGNESFSQWLKNLFGEIMTFPVVVALFMVANRITVTILGSLTLEQQAAGVQGALNNGTFWTPPFLYGLNQEALAFIVGMGILFIIPDLVKLYKETLGVSEFPVKIGLGTFFAGGAVAVGGGISLLMQFSSINQALLGDNKGLLNRFKNAFGEKAAGAKPLGTGSAAQKADNADQ